MDETLESTPPAPVQHAGDRLRAAREAAGLSLDDVSTRTRVPARHLAAIEEGRYGPNAGAAGESLPALTYSIGFAKAFASTVGLDPAEIAAQFRAEAEPDPQPETFRYEPIDASRVPSRRLAFAALTLVALVAIGLFLWGAGAFERTTPTEQAIDAMSEADGITPLPPGEGDAAADAAATSTDPSAATAAATAPASATPATVVLTATEDVWIKVYDRDDQTVRQGIMTAGEQWTVPGDPRQLLLWTGKAGALGISVDGRPVPSLGGPAETVRDVSLDPAALTARASGGTAAASGA